MRRNFIAMALIVLACGWASAQNAQPADQGLVKIEAPKVIPGASDPNITGVAVDPNAYVIGPLDVLYVKVFRDNGDFTGSYLVRPDGKITLPLIEDVQASGLTPERLTAQIKSALSEWIIKPDVNVLLEQVNSKYYYVTGEVNKPGRYPLLTEMRVFDAVNDTGGFKDFANRKKIVIVRGTDRFYFNYNDVKKGKKLEQNIPLQTGDTVIVE
jgi:polysaccharide biosynthesis/export protein